MRLYGIVAVPLSAMVCFMQAVLRVMLLQFSVGCRLVYYYHHCLWYHVAM